MHEVQFEETVDATLSAICEKRMVLPALLLLAGHRPLAFAFGQVLLILQPVAALLGGEGLGPWARLFSDPGGPSALSDRLAELLEKEHTAAGDLKSET